MRVTSGNFLEMYDFFLFGLYASHIAAAFFPRQDEFAALMSVFLTFAGGFLMRPLGAVFLGAYVDSVGPRKGLIVTLAIMAVGTLLICIVPGYRTIGVLAPTLVVAGRLLQGFSAGVELGGVSVYLAEIAPPHQKGFMVSWQSASQQAAIVFAAALGYGLSLVLNKEQMADFGWRIPFALGCCLVPFLFYIRASLQDTPGFRSRKHHPRLRQVWASILGNWPVVICGMFMVALTTTAFYLITVYTPTYAKNVLQLSESTSLIVTCCIGASNFFWLPFFGRLSDRVGRRPILLLFATLAVFTAYPALKWMVSAPGIGRLLAVELWLSLLFGGYNGAMVPALTEIMPRELRTTGFSVAYSLATALFGGCTAAISTWLIETTHNKASPGLWISCVAILAVGAVLILGQRFEGRQTAAIAN